MDSKFPFSSSNNKYEIADVGMLLMHIGNRKDCQETAQRVSSVVLFGEGESSDSGKLIHIFSVRDLVSVL